jgi:hypothetical protein
MTPVAPDATNKQAQIFAAVEMGAVYACRGYPSHAWAPVVVALRGPRPDIEVGARAG